MASRPGPPRSFRRNFSHSLGGPGRDAVARRALPCNAWGFQPAVNCMDMQFSRISILVVLPALVLNSGCATVERIPYPGDWPARVSDHACASASGHYANKAIASTFSAPRGNPLPTHGFLASLLLRGSPDNFDAEQLKISSVELDVAATEFVAHYAPGSAGIRKPVRSGWQCVQTGDFELRVSESTACEGCMPVTMVERTTLSAAVDGSLIMHMTQEWKSFYSRRDNWREWWVRFQRMP